MQDHNHSTRAVDPVDAEQLPLDVVLTCTTCDQTYTPTDEDLVRGHFGCPVPGCGGWVFSSALTVPTPQGGWRR